MDVSLLTLAHVTLCILLLIISFLIIAPLAVLVGNFDGNCIIGASITLNKDDVSAQDVPGAMGKCVYPEFMGFAVLFFAIVYIVWNSCLLFNSRSSSWRDSFIGTCISSLMSFLLLVSASVLSSGINKLCNALGTGEFSCDVQNYNDETWLQYFDAKGKLIPPEKIHSQAFHMLLKIAEVGSWLSFVVFILLMITYVIKMKLSSSGESFLSNFSRERERILDSTNQRRYDQI